MELLTYTYDQMTSEDKHILARDIREPTVIRGLYQPVAMKVKFEKMIKLFGNTELPVEIYDISDMVTTDAELGKSTVHSLLDHWKKNKKPSLYCAEVDLFTQNIPEIRKGILLETLRNPNTSMREVGELMLYLGNDHGSGLHLHVNSDFILNQLYGSKTVYIFNNYDNPNIHKNSVFSISKSNFAKEDFFKMDHSKMKVYKVTLQPGDSLLIPPWSWHATQGHGINMSITQVFDRKNISYLLKNPNLIMDYFIDDYTMVLMILLTIVFLILFIRRQYHHTR